MKITNPCRVYKICFIKILRAFNVKIKAKYIKVMHCKNRNFCWVFITLKFRYFFPVILGETQQGIFNAAPHEDTGNRSNQRAFNQCGLHCKGNHFFKDKCFPEKSIYLLLWISMWDETEYHPQLLPFVKVQIQKSTNTIMRPNNAVTEQTLL